MPVKRRLLKRRAELCHGERLFLAGVPWPVTEYEGDDPAERYVNSMVHCWLTSSWRDDNPVGGPTARELWTRYGAEALANWIELHPGRRPEPWWRFEAPGPRQRVGGIGSPWGDHQMNFGVPLIWVTRSTKSAWPRPPGPAICPTNPPVFESEATYLDRRGLLRPGERQRLREADFRPEPITEIFDFGNDLA